MSTIYNKITIDGTTYIDLSQDTASSASHIRSGYTAHLNDGTQVTGTYSGGATHTVTITGAGQNLNAYIYYNNVSYYNLDDVITVNENDTIRVLLSKGNGNFCYVNDVQVAGGPSSAVDYTYTVIADTDVSFSLSVGTSRVYINVNDVGSNDFIVTLSYDSNDDLWVPDKTLAEIVSAYNSGKTIATYAEDSVTGFMCESAGVYYEEDETFFYEVVTHDGATSTVNYYILDEYGMGSDGQDTFVKPSGSTSISSNGTYDVTYYESAIVNVSGGSPTIQSLTVTPSTSQQTFNASGVDGYKPVVVNAMTTMTLPTSAASSTTSGYTSKATIGRSTAAQYINIPPGYNSAGAYYTISAVANGSATAPSTISGTAASVSTGTNTLTLTKTVSVTPTVSAGYVSSGTAGNSSVSLTASVTTKAAATITPTTSNQTIAAGTYLTGAQTIAGDADLVGGNILSTANIFGVQGTVVVQNYYTGSSAPSSGTGSNGDLYLQT